MIPVHTGVGTALEVWLQNATEELNNLRSTVNFLLYERDWTHEKGKYEEQTESCTTDAGVQVGGEQEHTEMVRDLEREAFLKWSRLGQKQDDYFRRKEIQLEAARSIMEEEEAVIDEMLVAMEEEREEHGQIMEKIRAEISTLKEEEKMRRAEMQKVENEIKSRRRSAMQLELLEDHLMDSVLLRTNGIEEQLQKSAKIRAELGELMDEQKLRRLEMQSLDEEMERRQRSTKQMRLEEDALYNRLFHIRREIRRESKYLEEFWGEEGWASEYV